MNVKFFVLFSACVILSTIKIHAMNQDMADFNRTRELITNAEPDNRRNFSYFTAAQGFGRSYFGLGHRKVLNQYLSADFSWTLTPVPNMYTSIAHSDFRLLSLTYPTGKGLYLGLGLGITPYYVSYKYPNGFWNATQSAVLRFARMSIGYEIMTLKKKEAVVFAQLSGFLPVQISLGIGF